MNAVWWTLLMGLGDLLEMAGLYYRKIGSSMENIGSGMAAPSKSAVGAKAMKSLEPSSQCLYLVLKTQETSHFYQQWFHI